MPTMPDLDQIAASVKKLAAARNYWHDAATDAEDRIAALTAQRDRLLRFARAHQMTVTTPLAMPDQEYWETVELEYRAAWQALLDAGDLEDA